MSPCPVTSAAVSRSSTAVIAAVLYVQLLIVAAVFPIAGIWSSTPLLHIDHAYHLYQVRTAILLWRDHALVGFDPSFAAAGYLAGVTLNASAKVPALLAIALQPSLPPTVTYKAYVFASALLGPAAIMLAAVQLRLDSLACAALGMVTLLLWWASGFHWYHTARMVSFVLACFLALPWSIAAQRALIADEFNTPRLLILGAFAAFGLLLHPHFPIVASLMLIPSLLWNEGLRNPLRLLGRSALVMMVMILPNLPWLLALLAVPPTEVMASPYQKTTDFALIIQSAAGIWNGHSQGARINSALLITAIVGALLGMAGMRRYALIGLVTWLLISLLGALGAALPFVAPLQPNRWLLTAYIPLLIPAASAIALVLTPSKWRSRYSPVAAGITATVLVSALALPVVEMLREILPGPQDSRYGLGPPEVRPIGAQHAPVS